MQALLKKHIWWGTSTLTRYRQGRCNLDELLQKPYAHPIPHHLTPHLQIACNYSQCDTISTAFRERKRLATETPTANTPIQEKTAIEQTLRVMPNPDEVLLPKTHLSTTITLTSPCQKSQNPYNTNTVSLDPQNQSYKHVCSPSYWSRQNYKIHFFCSRDRTVPRWVGSEVADQKLLIV